MQPDRILVIDDDPSWQELLAESIQTAMDARSHQHVLCAARSFEEADALLDRRHFHLVFVDLRLKEEERELAGKRLARKIVSQDEGTSVVIATGHADVSTAITALREWNVLDFILKDEWDPDKVIHVVQTGLAQARLSYRSRYESSVDLLRGDEAIYPWAARFLDAFAPANEIDRPDRRLAGFMNHMLDGLHPLLRPADFRGMHLDPVTRIAAAQFWSKALGSPIALLVGRTRTFDAEAMARLGFNAIERVAEEPALGISGAVSVPAVPDFESFVHPSA